MNHIGLCIFFILFLNESISYSQHYFFKSYTTKDGLAHNQTFDVHQSKDNKLWVATLSGISCFNGIDFKTFSEKDGLASDLTIEVFEDSRGRIWVGTINNGISLIVNDKVLTPKDIDFASFGAINHFLELDDGRIFIFGNQAIGLFQNGEFSIVKSVENEEEGIFIMDASKLDAENFVLASIRRGVFKFNVNSYEITELINEKNGINNICYDVEVDDKNNIWIGSYGVLYKYNSGVVEEFVPDFDNIGANRMFDLITLDDGSISIATEGNGLLNFNPTTGAFEFLNTTKGLPAKYSYDHIVDNEGNIWLATFDAGLVRFKDKAFTLFNQESGMASNEVRTAVEWDKYWGVGTDKGLMIFKDGMPYKTLFKEEFIQALEVSSDEKLIVTTKEKVFQVDEYFDSKLIDNGNYLYSYQDSINTFLVGRNLKIINGDSTITRDYRRTKRIVPFGDGYLFMKLYGLFQMNNMQQDTIPNLNPKDYGVFRAITSINPNEALAINESFIFHLKKKGRAIQIDRISNDALKLVEPQAIQIKDSTVWIANENRLSKITLKDLLNGNPVKFTHYHSPQLFEGDESMQDNLLLTSSGKLLVPLPNGLLVFDPSKYREVRIPPVLNLSRTELFSEKLDRDDYTKNGIVLLSHEENYLTFYMEAITQSYPEKVQYKYRLKGIRKDNDWSPPTFDTKVIYSYLPPGDYEFQFTASNGVGIWNENILTFPFSIREPFWQTVTFWIIILMLSASISFLIYYLRNQNKLRQQRLFAQNLLQAQENERTRIARELHDSVGQKLMLLSKKTYETFPDLNILAQDTLSEVRAISRDLYPPHLEKLGITASLKNLINEIDEHTDLFFTHDIDNIDTLISSKSSLQLYRFVQEALSNVVKHSNARSVFVEIKEQSENINLVVEDNGIGFDVDKTIEQNSLGLKTLLERAKMLNASLRIQSNTQHGTRLHLILPTNEK